MMVHFNTRKSHKEEKRQDFFIFFYEYQAFGLKIKKIAFCILQI